MNGNESNKCILCGKPAIESFVFYTGEETSSQTTELAGGDRLITTQYGAVERHKEYFCRKCMINKKALRGLIIAIGLIVVAQLVCQIFGDTESGFFSWLTCIGVLAAVINLIRAIQKKNGALSNVASLFPGKTVFTKETDN